MRHSFHRMGRREKGIAAVVAFVLLCTAMYLYFGSQQGQKIKAKRTKPLVEVMTLSRQDMLRHVDLSGQTVADANVPLAPKYTGRIKAVYVDLGDEVKAGQILLEQDTSDLDISIQQNQAATGAASADAREEAATYNANYVKARNDLDLEADKYQRNQYLFSIGAISQDTLDSVKREYLASKAAFDVLADQADGGTAASVASKEYTAEKQQCATEALEHQRTDLFLRAPRDGVIGYRNAEAGAIVNAGTKVFSLVDNRHINVDCQLAEADAAILEPGMPVHVTIDALGQDVDGRIVYVSPAMDEDAKTFTVRIELDDTDLDIRAGLYAHTAIDILQRPDTLFVPKEAVVSRNGHTKVYIINADGKVEAREVKIGLMNDASEEILDGLEEGDVVILSNQDKLKEGMTVETKERETDSESGDET